MHGVMDLVPRFQLGPEKGVELRPNGQPRAAVPTWAEAVRLCGCKLKSYEKTSGGPVVS